MGFCPLKMMKMVMIEISLAKEVVSDQVKLQTDGEGAWRRHNSDASKVLNSFLIDHLVLEKAFPAFQFEAISVISLLLVISYSSSWWKLCQRSGHMTMIDQPLEMAWEMEAWLEKREWTVKIKSAQKMCFDIRPNFSQLLHSFLFILAFFSPNSFAKILQIEDLTCSLWDICKFL